MDETKTQEEFSSTFSTSSVPTIPLAVPNFPIFNIANTSTSVTQLPINSSYVTKVNNTRKIRMRPYFVPIKRKRTTSESKVTLESEIRTFHNSMMDTSSPFDNASMMEISSNSQANQPSTSSSRTSKLHQLKRSKSMEDLRSGTSSSTNPSIFNFNEMEFMSKFRISLNFQENKPDVNFKNKLGYY